MTTAYSTNLGLALPVQGELSGTWGDTVNNGITDYLDIAVAGTLTLNGDGAVTLVNTNGNASGTNIGSTTAQYAVLKVTNTTTAKTITAPSSSKSYVVINASSYAVTIKASGQTGVNIVAGETAGVVFNGTDYAKFASSNAATASTATTFTALQTFAGTASNAALKLVNAKEACTVAATAATGTINFDVTTQSVLYYTSNAAANWAVNFRGSSGTSLDTLMNTGESVTVAFLVTQGATAYYNNTVQVDGVSVTPKYQGGTAWSSGNTNSVDIYSYTIIKTGAGTFTVFASQTKFA